MGEVTASRYSPRPPQGGEGVGEGGSVLAFIGLGANLGDRKENILAAIEHLKRVSGVHVLKLSTLAETAPIGPVQEQPNFINAVVAIKTSLAALDLLDQLLLIENHMGRIRVERWGPRVIDLDLLTYGDQNITHARLVVPHPEIKNRPFVLAAMTELREDLSPHPHPLPQGERA